MNEAPVRTNLLGMTRPELEAFVGGFGTKPYRARQLLKWIYRRGAGSAMMGVHARPSDRRAHAA